MTNLDPQRQALRQESTPLAKESPEKGSLYRASLSLGWIGFMPSLKARDFC
jgi:hypothetical protein